MFRKLPLILAVLLALSHAAFGAICALDPKPGATLLLPYFEVDANGPPGPDTIFTVINSSQQGVIAQVVIWSETGFPVFAFPLYLGGYDEQSVALSEIVLKTTYPTTRLSALARQRFPNCPSVLEKNSGPHIPPLPGTSGMLEHLNGSSLLPIARPPSQTGSHLARGFVTVDVVRDCSRLIPGDLGYFYSGGWGVATNNNVLWGHFLYTDLRAGQGFVQGGRMVSLEADGSDPRTATRGSYTFYARRVGFSAADNREPLGTVQAVQYLAGEGLEAEAVYWRDSRDFGTMGTGLPGWLPLIETQVTIFNEERRGTSVPLPPELPIFPAMTGKTALIPPPHPLPSEPVPFPTTALDRLLVEYPFGWIHLNLNLPRVGAASIPSQSWAAVVVRRRGDPSMSVLLEGTSMDSACAPNLAPLVLPGLPLRRRLGGE